MGLIVDGLLQLENVDTLKAKIYDAAEVIANGEPKRSKEEALNQYAPQYLW